MDHGLWLILNLATARVGLSFLSAPWQRWGMPIVRRNALPAWAGYYG